MKGEKAVICEALGFYSMVDAKWSYLKFFGGTYTRFKLTPW